MSASNVAHQFDTVEQQHFASTLGIWVFLVTEIMFFGGAFLGYTVYRWREPEAFAHGSRHLDLVSGAVNTVVLLVSSFTMAMAVRGGHRRAFLAATMVLGLVFLGIKVSEYSHSWMARPAAPADEQIFYSFYFTMTGIHAAHMIVGIGVLGYLLARPKSWVENAGLYWHFVDLVWIFLFPLFYLVGRHA